MTRARYCWTTVEDFILSIGAVNAEVRFLGKSGERYASSYRLVAERIESMAKSTGARVLATVTDEGLYVVTARGFYIKSGA